MFDIAMATIFACFVLLMIAFGCLWFVDALNDFGDDDGKGL